MMNDSFDGGHMGGGGGWNETMYGEQGGGGVGDANSTSARIEKVHIPVTVPDLSQTDSNDDKFTIGRYSFSTVLIVGKVVGKVESEQTVRYTIQAPNGIGPTIAVDQFRDSNYSPTFIEDTLVRLSGKLRSYDGKTGVMALYIRELEDERECEAHELEAQLAQLYYTKDVPEMAAKNELNLFRGTMLRPAGDDEGGSGAPQAYNGGGASGGMMRTGSGGGAGSGTASSYNNAPFGSGGSVGGGNNRGLKGQRALIYEFIGRAPASDVGVSRADILRMPSLNRATGESDLNFLINEGHIYSTIDDDHYSCVD